MLIDINVSIILNGISKLKTDNWTEKKNLN